MTDTLKSICERSIHLREPQLNFLPAESLRQKEIILRDIADLVSVASLEMHKAVTVLAGMVFESLLASFIPGQIDYISARRGELFVFDSEGSLKNYVEIFNRYFASVLVIPDMVIDCRNFVHIKREMQYPRDYCQIAAPEMLRLLDSFLAKLTDYAGR